MEDRWCERATLRGHEGAVLCCRFNATGQYLMSCGRDKVRGSWPKMQRARVLFLPLVELAANASCVSFSLQNVWTMSNDTRDALVTHRLSAYGAPSAAPVPRC